MFEVWGLFWVPVELWQLQNLHQLTHYTIDSYIVIWPSNIVDISLMSKQILQSAYTRWHPIRGPVPQWFHIGPIRGRVLIISDSFIRKWWCKDNCQVESEVVRTVLNFQPISGHTDSQVDQWEGSKGLLVSW